MKLTDHALRVAFLKALSDYIKEADGDARYELMSAYSDAGAKSAAAVLPDGVEVAVVTMTTPKESVTHNGPMLLEWARKHRPDLIMPERTVVMPAEVDTDALMADVVWDGAIAFDKTTGEQIIGLSKEHRPPYPTVRFKENGRKHLSDAYANRVLDIGGMPMLMEGASE